ncbi:unnamed protein product [Didymodactylos carnosus]|uniref:Uncharacterized protein n=1 Tax=Didymodactylos carnosus TaxID=1234261 RepID=A0A815EEM4_9BILA|nr:unnamed protein product [Didymodactylos carnosus]CAF4153654.1 unnamed protein product [Didymodactylos carnosus]
MSENKTKFLPRRNPHIYYVPRKPDVQKGVLFTPKTNHIQPLHKQIYFRPPLLPALPTSRKREQLKSNSRPVQLLPIHRQKEKSTSVPRLKYVPSSPSAKSTVPSSPSTGHKIYHSKESAENPRSRWKKAFKLVKESNQKNKIETINLNRTNNGYISSDNGYSSSNRYENSLRMHQRKQQRYDEQAKLFGETLTLVRFEERFLYANIPQPIIYPQNMYNSLNMSNACAWRPAMTRMGPAGG